MSHSLNWIATGPMRCNRDLLEQGCQIVSRKGHCRCWFLFQSVRSHSWFHLFNSLNLALNRLKRSFCLNWLKACTHTVSLWIRFNIPFSIIWTHGTNVTRWPAISIFQCTICKNVKNENYKKYARSKMFCNHNNKTIMPIFIK